MKIAFEGDVKSPHKLKWVVAMLLPGEDPTERVSVVQPMRLLMRDGSEMYCPAELVDGEFLIAKAELSERPVSVLDNMKAHLANGKIIHVKPFFLTEDNDFHICKSELYEYRRSHREVTAK